MGIHTGKAQGVLHKWFQKVPDWQKDMFCAIWRGTLSEELLVKRAIKLIGQEYKLSDHHLTANTEFPDDIDFSDSENIPIMLKNISQVQGVGALSATAPLEFGQGLTVVYGENGCGKSSYVKILKASENPAFSDAIVGDIFSEENIPASALLTFTFDGTDDPVYWTKANKKKHPILIYDTEIGHQFVDKANEVIYEPKVLSAISKMATVFSLLTEYYQNTSQDFEKKYFPVENEIVNCSLIEEFRQIKTVSALNEFGSRITWNETTDKKLASIIASLAVSESSKKARSLKAQKELVSRHSAIILRQIQLICPDSCKMFLDKRKKQIDTKYAADMLTESSTHKSKLNQFGKNSWKNMWNSSIKYASDIEGSLKDTPDSPDGLCVLCQQNLDEESRIRFSSFKEYTTSQIYADAETALKDFQGVVTALQEDVKNELNIPKIEMDLISCGVSDNICAYILKCYRMILNRCEWLLNFDSGTEEKIPDSIPREEITAEFKKILDELDTQIKALEQTAENREKQIIRKNELLAVQWIFNNLSVKKSLITLSAIQSKCKTNGITTLKKDLSDILITESYIARFSNEMQQLDTSGQIKVELAASGAKKGRAYHQISLKGAKAGKAKKTGDVLSEGEYRVVSLAAFLADISSWGKLMPFVFDDPITSLDHKFEKRVAQRLIELSTQRQVIVFTHRLAFAQFLDVSVNEYNAAAAQSGSLKHAEVKHVELRSTPLGQPTEAGYIENIAFTKKINAILNTDVPRIKKAQKAGDYILSDSLMRSLCTQFRNLVERGIEQELLSGVVQRFARNVSTLKLPRLYALSGDDISLFDQLMTKYSYFDHSQSLETPIALPSIEDIEGDLNRLSAWHKDFKNRCETEEKKAKGKA